MSAFHRHFQLAVTAALATYLLLLGAGMYGEGVYAFMVARPVRYLEKALVTQADLIVTVGLDAVELQPKAWPYTLPVLASTHGTLP